MSTYMIVIIAISFLIWNVVGLVAGIVMCLENSFRGKRLIQKIIMYILLGPFFCVVMLVLFFIGLFVDYFCGLFYDYFIKPWWEKRA